MSASLIPGYTGLLENPQVTKVARILRVPITDGATIYGRYGASAAVGIGGPTERHSYSVMRDALFDAIRVHENDAETEGEVFNLLARWDAAIADESNADEGLRRSAPDRKRVIKRELVIIYPVFAEEHQGQDVIGGR